MEHNQTVRPEVLKHLHEKLHPDSGSPAFFTAPLAHLRCADAHHRHIYPPALDHWLCVMDVEASGEWLLSAVPLLS